MGKGKSFHGVYRVIVQKYFNENGYLPLIKQNDDYLLVLRSSLLGSAMLIILSF